MRKLILTAGFTIVELIAVIAIISILTGLLLAGVSKVRASAKIKKAKATIEQLEVALEMYSQNYGTYPNDDGLSGGKFPGCSVLINALESETPQAKERGGPYVKFPAELKDGSGNLLDLWGQPYRYHWHTYQSTPPYYNVTAIGQESGKPNITYNIWSPASNKINDEWISNPNYPGPLPTEEQRRNSDDIVNW